MNRTTGTRLAVPALLALAATLTACGGGGGGGGAAPAAPAAGTYNVQAAFRNVLSTGGTWNLPDRSNATATYTVSIAPAAAAAFPLNGTTYARSVSNTILAGLKLPPADGTIYYELSGNSVKVIGNQVSGECGSNPGAATEVALPTAAQVNGAPATVYSLSLRPDCNPATAPGPTVNIQWQLVQDSQTAIVLFCLNNPPSGAGEVVSTCIEIDAAGNLLGRARLARGPANGTATFEARNF
ncbi:hypothetical protein [Aquabacterium sp. J223]|uniref:hypothetical protein n=1 Tax=Aquabacterium sp. J223 TaxID=2898431 RepID=UPI0021AE1C3F|nr:hypothetical protein [Aquabacterium sp. J223]UUX95545.1 hypothetical protein LRS07_20455 [Aquabacterium sp. J223]